MNRRFLSGLMIAFLPVAMALIGAVMMQTRLETRLMKDAETRLHAELDSYAALYDQRRIIAVRQAMEFRATTGETGDTGALFMLLDRQGEVLAGNLDSWPNDLTRPAEGEAPVVMPLALEKDGQDMTHLVAAQPLRGGFAMLVGVGLAPLNDTMAAFRRIVLGFAALMAAAGLLVAWAMSYRAERQMLALNRALDDIGRTRGLEQRLAGQEGEGRGEFATLRAHINAMLDRIAHLFAAHGRLGDTVAHEMRTPLARIQSQLEKLDIDAAARAGLDDEIRATIRLFDSLLSIAAMDAEAGSSAGLDPLDLSAVCEGIVNLYQPVAEEEDRHLEAAILPDAMILGDGQLLAQMVSNLVENGIKYTRPGDMVRVSLSDAGDQVVLRVSDTGPGVEGDVGETLLRPFARGAGTEAKPGHGLGLSLVRAIALRHGAVLRLPETGVGFAVEITFRRYAP
ncbi:sensor histidine kinase [Shimia biformata]|uniref:sensor histidine kinase n=1 Tax=Shimia biformata TaxID=1294299 RepID=UPI00195274DF|nr:HAMP domain-containing sensor histidine kinase [Shimia biformata]